ncbi:Uncharacterised protein [Brucella melitensis]|nr:Uncharacterised protein [Brucella melitensis]
MGQVFDLIDIGDINRHFIILLDSEFGGEAERRGRRHIDTHLVAVTHHFIGFHQIKTVRLCLRHGIGKKWILRLQKLTGLILER